MLFTVRSVQELKRGLCRDYWDWSDRFDVCKGLQKLMGARVIVAGRNPMKLKAAEDFAHADEIVVFEKIS